MISKHIKGRKDGKSSALDSLRYGEGLKVDRESGEYLDKSHRSRLGGFGIVDNGIYADYGIDAMSKIIARAAIEMQANCDMNTKVRADKKIAHFIYSFDQDQPSDSVLRDTEDSTLAVLGLSRNHFATFLHNDNGHWHLHMFISRIGKEPPHNGNSLWRDQTLRDKVCREIEIRHGLKHDNGLHEVTPAGVIVEVPIAERRKRRKDKIALKPQISDAARKTEIYSGEQTFQSWANSFHIGDRLKHAQSWADLHSAAAAYGCEIKQKGAGFILCPKDQVGAIQLSKIGIKSLPSKFGTFQPASVEPSASPVQSFKSAPTQETAVSHFDEWRGARDAFKPVKTDRQNEQREAHRNRRKEVRARHKTELDQVRVTNSGTARFAAVSIAKMNHVAQLASLTEQFRADRQALAALLTAQGPGNTFRDYLVKRAGAGDDAALTLTRQYGAAEMTRVLHEREARSLGLVAAVSGRDDVALRRPVVHHRIERNGTVVFDLGRGCTVTDSAFAKQIQLNDVAANNSAAIATSLRFAAARFGSTLTLTGSVEFQKLAVETAVRSDLHIKFADPALEQYRQEIEQARRAGSRGPIDLSHLTSTQVAKGAERVLRRSFDKGVPPEHIIRAQQHRRRATSAAAGGMHELPVGGVDGEGQGGAGVLPNPVHGRLGDDERRHDHDVRRTGASEASHRGDRAAASPAASTGATAGAETGGDIERAGLPAAGNVRGSSGQGVAKLQRDRRGLGESNHVPATTAYTAPASSAAVRSAHAWVEDWAAEQKKSVKAPTGGRGDVSYQVVYIAADGVVLDLGRAGAVYAMPKDLKLQVGDRVVVDQDARIQLPKDLSNEIRGLDR